MSKPNDWQERFISRFYGYIGFNKWGDDVESFIKAELERVEQSAIEEERESCAKVAEKVMEVGDGNFVARAIRERSLTTCQHECWCEYKRSVGSTFPPCEELAHGSPRKCHKCGQLIVKES